MTEGFLALSVGSVDKGTVVAAVTHRWFRKQNWGTSWRVSIFHTWRLLGKLSRSLKEISIIFAMFSLLCPLTGTGTFADALLCLMTRCYRAAF